VTDLAYFPKIHFDSDLKMFSAHGFKERGIDGFFLNNIQNFMQIFLILFVAKKIVSFIKWKILKGLENSNFFILKYSYKLIQNLYECFNHSILIGYGCMVYLNSSIFSML
jgi:hypothetical protein